MSAYYTAGFEELGSARKNPGRKPVLMSSNGSTLLELSTESSSTATDDCTYSSSASVACDTEAPFRHRLPPYALAGLVTKAAIG